jgi:5-methylcytosine-specific restriction endonuclease McrA
MSTVQLNSVLSASEVDARLRAALDELQAAQRNAVLWFAEILNRHLYRELGYSSIHAYAAEALGFSRARTFYFLKLCRSLESLPALKASVESGALPWTKAVEVARVATPGTEGIWIAEAQRTGRRELARKVAGLKARVRVTRQADATQTDLALAGSAGATASETDVRTSALVEATMAETAVSVTFDFTPEQYARYEALVERARKSGERGSREELLLAALEQLAGHAQSSRVSLTRQRSGHARSSRLDLKANAAELHAPTPERVHLSHPRYQVVVTQCPDCGRAEVQTNRGAKPLGLPALQAVLCDARVQHKGEKNRATIPPARRREALARDGYRCRASGCGSAHFLDVHHMIPRERGGTNDPDNLITLCTACHRLIHERGLPMRMISI